MSVGRIFSRGANSGFFQGETLVKFHLAHSKLREQPFFAKNLIGKYQISKSRTGPRSPSWRPWPQLHGICRSTSSTSL